MFEEHIAASEAWLASAIGIQDDLIVSHLVHFGTQQQRERRLPGLASATSSGRSR